MFLAIQPLGVLCNRGPSPWRHRKVEEMNHERQTLLRYHPQVRQRHSLLSSFKPYRNAGRPGHAGGDWARYQRIQRDSLYAPVQGHGFSDWWERFGETHPEYFALQPDGSRSGFPSPGAAPGDSPRFIRIFPVLSNASRAGDTRPLTLTHSLQEND